MSSSTKQKMADNNTIYEVDAEGLITLVATAAEQGGENGSTAKKSSVRIDSKNIITVTRSAEDESSIIWHIDTSPDARASQSPDDIEKALKSKKISSWFTLSRARVKNFQPTDQYPLQALPAHLSIPRSENGEPNIHAIVSTKSGTGEALEYFESVLKPLLEGVGLGETAYKRMNTSSVESVKDFARDVLLERADRGEEQTVILLSGDGGIVDILNGLLENKIRSKFVPILSYPQSPSNILRTYRRPKICLLPLGTGNALFHSTYRHAVPSQVLGLYSLLHGLPKPLPSFKAVFSPGARILRNEGQDAVPLGSKSALFGAVVASYGFHATLVADSDTVEYRKHGSARFQMIAKDLLFPEKVGDEESRPHAYKAKVILLKDTGNESGSLEKEVLIDRKEHGYVLVSLVSNLEENFKISPWNEPLEGRLRICQFGAFSGEKIMEIMTKAYDDGKHIDIQEVRYEDIRGIKIVFEEEDEKWRRVCIDGAIVRIERDGWMEVRNLKKGGEAVDVVVTI